MIDRTPEVSSMRNTGMWGFFDRRTSDVNRTKFWR